ncbi:MAG TPA: helix-turn-helix domain-containing protein [Solirubrobacterales bacterium]|nr:helix-turn-helix domain-containing protein [Solirubrobacterales bacterium]
MTNSFESEPWRGLPDSIADLIEPELAKVTEEILGAIAREVPEYARPLEGRFGRGIRTGVGEALSQFVALIRDPDAGRGLGREVYVALGRGELRQGRTLDSLQSAYRVGARVAWRHLARVGREAGLDAEVLSLLAEAIFAYIDELSADSVEGYAAAQSEHEDLRRRRREEVLASLMREPAAPLADVRAAGRAAGWKVPRVLAVLSCAVDDLGPIARRLSSDALSASFEGIGCVLVPDPAGPGRSAEISRAVGDRAAALGPAGPPDQTRESWQLAKAGLRAHEAGLGPAKGLLQADDHLGDLAILEGGTLPKRIAAHRLSSLESLTENGRERMRETALAYVRQRGNSVAMAAELHIHPQTARYRLARLRELLGDQLDDPDARFELEIALRAPGHG